MFPFHYGPEAENYTFYRVPKLLFSEPEFSCLSTDAKMLYGLLLDRMQLSIRNNWVDNLGRVYIYYKVESVMAALSCGNKKACSLLAELDDKKGIGLITRIKQGMGRPDRIYVHKCISEEMSKRHFMKCQDDISGVVNLTPHAVSISHRNNTYISDTEKNDNEPICSYPSDRKGWTDYFKSVLSMDSLLKEYPLKADTIEEIIMLLVDVCSSGQTYIRIAGDEKPADAVRGTFMLLTDSHIRYVLECLNETGSKIRNIRQYLLTSLYNSTMTISNYYDAEVRHDMFRNGYAASRLRNINGGENGQKKTERSD